MTTTGGIPCGARPDLSIVVVTWDNLTALKTCLASLRAAISRFGRPAEVIVMDNGSRDGTAEYLRSAGWLRWCSFDRNTGFGPASNAGVMMAGAPLVALLNDDIQVEQDLFVRLERHFSSPEVFAVAPKMVLNGTVLGGRSVGAFRDGILRIEIDHSQDDRVAATLFVGGGAGLFRRSMFVELGGFDPLFHPFYYEDLDLCYRAWKRGWTCLADQSGTVHHEHAGTIGRRFSRRYVYATGQRNYWLFHWKNIHDRTWTRDHGRALLRNLAGASAGGRAGDVLGITRAMGRLLPTLRQRRREREQSRRSDRDVLRDVAHG